MEYERRPSGLIVPRHRGEPCSLLMMTHLFGFGVGGGREPVQPVFNGADKDSDVTLTNSDLTMSMPGSTTGGVRTTAAVAGGKAYWEVQQDNVGSATRIGIANGSYVVSGAPGHDANSWSVDGDGNVRNNSSTAIRDIGVMPAATGGILMFALDMDAGKLWIGDADANTWYESGDPAAGTGEQFSGITGPIYVCAGRSSGGSTRGATLPVLASYLRSPPAGFTAGL